MDQQLLFLINRQWTSPALDWLMATVSCFDAWVPLLVVAGLILVARGGFKARAFVLTAVAIVGINDGVISNTLKRAVNRPRPHQALSDVRQVDLSKATPRVRALFRPAVMKLSRAATGDVQGRSFPSGHTINSFSAALVALCFYGKRAAWSLGLAALIGYSRIYNGAHWPSDVLPSALLACGATLLLLALAEWLWHSAGRRALPALHAQHPRLLAS